jgi:hypothetical protein
MTWIRQVGVIPPPHLRVESEAEPESDGLLAARASSGVNAIPLSSPGQGRARPSASRPLNDGRSSSNGKYLRRFVQTGGIADMQLAIMLSYSRRIQVVR